MAYKQVVKPDLNTVDGLGWCLRFSQSVFRAPVAYPSARAAWDGQRGRHTGQPPKGVAVPVWFDHWGTYQGRWANWGHVAISLGDGRFFTSPLLNSHLGKGGVGSAYYPNMAAMQSHIGGNPKYLGWSESMNGKQVVDVAPKPAPVPVVPEEEDEEMAESHSMEAKINGTLTQCIYDRDGFITEWIGGNATYNANIRKQHGVKTLHCSVTESHYNAIKRSVLAKSNTTVKLEIPTIPVLPEKNA